MNALKITTIGFALSILFSCENSGNQNLSIKIDNVETKKQFNNILQSDPANQTEWECPNEILEIPLGSAINSYNVEQVLMFNNDAFDSSSIKISNFQESKYTNLLFDQIQVKDEASFYKYNNINVSAQGRYLVFKGSAGADIQSSFSQSSGKYFWYVDLIKIKGVKYLKSLPKFSKAAQNIIKDNRMSDFSTFFGDQYVYAVVYGSKLRIKFEYETEIKESSKEASAFVNATINAIKGSGKFSAEYQNKLRQKYDNSTLHISYEFTGVPDDTLLAHLITSDINNISQRFESFVAQNQPEKNFPIYYYSRYYDIDTKRVSDQTDVFAKFIDLTTTLNNELFLINQAINSQYLNENSKRDFHLKEQKNNRELAVLELTEKAKEYMVDGDPIKFIKAKQNIDTFNLKLPIYPILEALLSSTSVSNSAFSPTLTLRNLTPGSFIQLAITFTVTPGQNVNNNRNWCHSSDIHINDGTPEQVLLSFAPPCANDCSCPLTYSKSLKVKVPNSKIITVVFENRYTQSNGNYTSAILSGFSLTGELMKE